MPSYLQEAKEDDREGCVEEKKGQDHDDELDSSAQASKVAEKEDVVVAVPPKKKEEEEDENEVLILTMQKYLQSDGYVTVMGQFLDQHAASFIGVECYTQEHFQVFKQFQLIAEEAVESVGR